MKKFIMTVAVASVLAIAGSVSAATFVYTGGIIKVGSRGPVVADLQTCMNGLGYNTGVVDGIFGQNTKAGVMAFQASKGLAVDGIIGPQTGPEFTAACATLESGNEGSSTSNNNGCQEGWIVNPVTGESCSTEGTTMGTSGEEASLKDFNLKAGDDDTIYEGEEGEIARIEFDVEDADAVIERADLTFDYQGTAAGEDKPWKAFKKITLKADGKEIASEDVTDDDDWQVDTDPYVYRFTGLNYLVKDGDKARISVIVEAEDSVDGSTDSANNKWEVYVDTDGIRALDEAGISQYIGDGTDKESFNIEDESAGEDITLKSSSQDPDAGLIQVYDDKVSDEEKVFVFKLEADEHDIDIDHITLDFIVTGNAWDDTNDDGVQDAGEVTPVIYDNVVNDIWLEVNGEKFDDYTVTNGNTATASLDFDLDKDLTIDADDEENVKLMVEFREQSDDLYLPGTEVQAKVTGVTGEGVDDVSDTTTISGETHKLVLAVPTVTLEGKDSSLNDDETVATFSYQVKVAADDDDITFDTATDVVTKVLGPNPALGTTTVLKLSGDAEENGTEYTILAGDDATFAVDIVVDPDAGDTGVYYAELTSFAGETLEEITGPENITVA